MAVRYPDPHRTLRRGQNGHDARAFQAGLNERLAHIPTHLRPDFVKPLKIDGDFGDETMLVWRVVRHAIGLPKWLPPTQRAQMNVRRPETRSRTAKSRARLRRKPPRIPLNERAYQQAVKLIGVMEQGGNNAGVMVSKIIRANGGGGPEPWCGDFVAYCYRLAGSKSVTRSWAAVALLRGVAGVFGTGSPRRGDLVRFTFDHVGMFSRRVSSTEIETVEGNTGSSGAVSDSSTGGDGVYRKRRSMGLVLDYLRVTR